MDNAKEFIEKFHSLEGITVGEKQKSFQNLLNQNASILKDPNISECITRNLVPESHNEKLLRIKFLLYCQRMPELIEILKSGEEVFICQVMKNQWFMQNAFTDLTPQQIMDDILPHMSYSVRVKYLKKIEFWFHDEDKIYGLFHCIKIKYGLQYALPLLLGCSADNIEFVIRNNPIFFTNGQLKLLVRKAFQVLPVYIEEYVKHKGEKPRLSSNLLSELGSKDITTYRKVSQRYGRRLTKRIFEHEKEKILAKPGEYVKIFKRDTFVRKLGENKCFKPYFQGLFPKSIENFYFDSDLEYLINGYPKNKRFHLLKDTFEQLYKVPLLDYHSILRTPILQLMTDVTERETTAAKLFELTNDSDYIVFENPSKSIPFIKNEIDLTTQESQRRKQIKLLVDVCKMNDDIGLLAKITQYISSRHRNDVTVLHCFLAYIEKKVDLHSLTGEIWKLILEMIEVYGMKVKSGNYFKTFLLHFLEFSYNNGEARDKYLLNYMTHDKGGDFILEHKCQNFQFIKQMILDYITLLPKDCDVRLLLKHICKWNKQHPDYEISYENNSQLLQRLKNQTYSDPSETEFLWFLISTKNRSDFIEELTNVLWKEHAGTATAESICYFLKWYPLILFKYNDLFFNSLIVHEISLGVILSWIKKYEHLELPRKIVEYNQNKLETGLKFEDEMNYERVLIMLASLMKQEEFISYVKKHKPSSLNVDASESKETSLYNLRCAFVKSFKYLNPPALILPIIMEYLGGDYLKCSLTPLYSAFHRAPENMLDHYVNQLACNKAISVRKHSIFLSFKVRDLKSIEEVLKLVSSNEKNKSLQKRLILATFECLKKNQSDEFWYLFKTSLGSVNKNDNSLFEYLLGDCTYIPKKYTTRYFQEIWRLLQRKDQTMSFKFPLLYNFVRRSIIYSSPAIEEFPVEFCHEIIDVIFCQLVNGVSYSEVINTFIYKFLMQHENPESFQRILGILRLSQTTYAADAKSNKSIKNLICSFIEQLCDEVFSVGKLKQWNVTCWLEFTGQLSKLYPDVEFFSKYLFLLYTSVLVAAIDMQDYAQKVSETSEMILSKYGPYFFEDVQIVVLRTLKFFATGKSSYAVHIEFIKTLLEVKTSEINYVICLELIQNTNRSEPGYESCVQMLKQSNLPYILVMLRRKNII